MDNQQGSQPTAQTMSSSYLTAAWLVIFGVIGVWVVLKQTSNESVSALPDLPDFQMLSSERATETLLEKANAAFAAGRVARPEGDSAMYFYQQQLAASPEDSEAQAGLNRVVGFLINGAEAALLRKDWSTAQDLAQQVTTIETKNRAARSVLRRLQKRQRVQGLTEAAIAQLEAGKLIAPNGDNALASYQAVLKIEPGNVTAEQGINSIAQRLATMAQAKAFADEEDEALALLEEAKKIAPDAPGLAETEQLTQEWASMTQDQLQTEQLAQAVQAGQAGDLDRALELYQAVIEERPESETAKAGLKFIASAFIDEAWVSMRAEDSLAADAKIRKARAAGAEDALLQGAETELEFIQRLTRARAGEFLVDDYVPISKLAVRRRVEPETAEGGVVQLEFTVDEQGAVQDIEVSESDSESLRIAAVEAVGKWRFAPYEVAGRPLPVRTGVRMRIQT